MNKEDVKKDAVLDKTLEEDIVDVSRQFLKDIQEDENQQPPVNREVVNMTLTDADIHLVGDWMVLAEVTQLLAQIRHALRNNMKTDIIVRIGQTQQSVANPEFNFDANRCQVPDVITQSETYIN